MGWLDGVSGWLARLIALIIMAAFADMLVPRGVYQGYLRMIFGLLIILGVAGPALGLVQVAAGGGRDLLRAETLGGTPPSLTVSAGQGFEDVSRRLMAAQEEMAVVEYQRALETNVAVASLRVDGVAEVEVSVRLEPAAPGVTQSQPPAVAGVEILAGRFPSGLSGRNATEIEKEKAGILRDLKASAGAVLGISGDRVTVRIRD